jgi:hypothetical protein
MRFANFDGEVEDVAAAKAFLEREHGQRVVGLLGAAGERGVRAGGGPRPGARSMRRVRR